MGKVLFVMKYPLEEQYSIIHKLNGQMQAVKELGHDVYFISFDRKQLYLNHAGSREIIKKTTAGSSKIYYHLISFYDLYIAAKKVIGSEKFDLIYFRYAPMNFMGYAFLKAAARLSRVVVEIPTFPPDSEKQKTALRRLYMKFSDFWWKKSAKYIKLFTLIGDKADSYMGVPALNIDNGVSVDAVPLKSGSVSSDGKMHLLAVAAMSKWQGYDRIIRGLAEWDDPKAENYIIDMVGDEGDGSLLEWKKLALDCHLEKQVLFHGRLSGEALTRMYESARIGLGSLGMYRKGMDSGSVLKIREYMARGLPFIYANEDPALSDDMPWCIKFPNDGTPICMERVDDFILSLENCRDFGEKMRQYAKINMSWTAQFTRVFDALNVIDGEKVNG